MNPDGYIELKDRAQHVTLSGGKTSGRLKSKRSLPAIPPCTKWRGRHARPPLGEILAPFLDPAATMALAPKPTSTLATIA
jgi:hypothetical protein